MSHSKTLPVLFAATNHAGRLALLPQEGRPVFMSPSDIDISRAQLARFLSRHPSLEYIVVDGERDRETVLTLLDDHASLPVKDCSLALRLSEARRAMLYFYAHRLPRDDAESDARALRMGWRSLVDGGLWNPREKGVRAPAGQYSPDDLSVEVEIVCRRLKAPGSRVVLELLRFTGVDDLILREGARAALQMRDLASRREKGTFWYFTDWVASDRLAIWYTEYETGELVSHAEGTLQKVLNWLELRAAYRTDVALELSYCRYDDDVDDEGWDLQALFEAAKGLRPPRCTAFGR